MLESGKVKVSVLMPLFNTNPQHLCVAIESILNQTFTDFEFLILNDSPENSELAQIVKNYQDSRIIYIVNDKNLGISASRNKLIRMARGEYLAVMDHDDISLPERFQEEVKVLDDDLAIGVVSCFFRKIGTEEIIKRPAKSEDIIRGLISRHCNVLHPAAMMRKSVLEENHVFYEEVFSPAEDFAMWCRLIGKTKFYNIPKLLFLYREHDNNTSARQRSKMKTATKKICEFTRKQHPDLWNEMKNTNRYFIRVFGIPVIKVKKDSFLTTRFFLFGFIPYYKKEND